MSTMKNDQLLHQVKAWWARRDGKPSWGELSIPDKQALIEQYRREQSKK